MVRSNYLLFFSKFPPYFTCPCHAFFMYIILKIFLNMSDNHEEKPSQSATHCGQILMDMFSLAAYTTIIVTLSVSISYHPMLQHVQGKDRSLAYNHINNTVYTNTYITHRTPFAKYMLPENNTFVETMDLQKHQKKQEVYRKGVFETFKGLNISDRATQPLMKRQEQERCTFTWAVALYDCQ